MTAPILAWSSGTLTTSMLLALFGFVGSAALALLLAAVAGLLAASVFYVVTRVIRWAS